MALLAMYGGAFDPVHEGHLAVARAARDGLDAELLLVPTGDPRHRGPAQASGVHRLAMLRLAIEGEPRLRIETRELERDGPSYTVETLESLRAELGPEQALAMIVGDDSFAGLPTWHRWTELFELAHVVVVDRPQAAPIPGALASAVRHRWCEDPQRLHEAPAGRTFRLHMPLQPQSSSAVRARLATGASLGTWVPPAVATYIRAQRLYTSA